LFRSYILKFYVISKPLFVLFDLIKYPDLDSVCTCLWVDGASVGTQKEGKMYRKRGGLRECLTIPSTNSNVNRVRVHPLLASETNEGYTSNEQFHSLMVSVALKASGVVESEIASRLGVSLDLNFVVTSLMSTKSWTVVSASCLSLAV